MTSKFKKYTLAAPVLATLFLVGCGEPSSSDIKTAINASLEQSKAQAAKMGGGLAGNMMDKMFPTIGEVNKIGCTEANPSGYNCDVEIETTSKMAGHKIQTSKLRLIKGSDGWVIAE